MCGFKTGGIGGRNFNNLCCADDSIVIVKNATDLQALVMKIKEQNETK